MNDSQLVEQTEQSLRQAIDDYFRHTPQNKVYDNISDNFIARLARDSVRAKTELRELFRQSKVLDENLQASSSTARKRTSPITRRFAAWRIESSTVLIARSATDIH